MEMDSFAKLEERINRAVAHIDELTRKFNAVEGDNSELRAKIKQLETELKEKQTALTDLMERSTRLSEKVKDRIEGLLGRIEGYEKK